MINIAPYLALFCWTILTIFVVFSLPSLFYKPKRAWRKAYNVEFVIVSIASKSVENSLMECIKHNKTMFNSLTVLVDEGADLLPQLSDENLVVVPKGYRPDLVGKGRAMNYFIETVVDPKTWYAFVDDDNLLLDDKFMFEIPYYERLGYVAMNPILVPRKGKSTMLFIMDWIRFFDDETVFKLFTGLLKTPMLGLHGELLTVKGAVLKEIGYNDKTLTEDFRFASKIVKSNYKTWQSATKVSIRPPNSIPDFMKQRGRWFRGASADWFYCPPTMQVIVGIRLVIWILGIFGSWLFLPIWIHTAFVYALPGGLYYWGIYIYGTYKSSKLCYLPIIPAYGILECMSIIAGLRQENFEVINKN